MIKIIVLACLLKGTLFQSPGIFLPFLPLFDSLKGLGLAPQMFARILQGAFLFGATLLYLNCRVRFFSFFLGVILLVAILSSRTYYQNNRFFCACLLLLTGLQELGGSPWLLRGQVVLVYLGAGLNKLLSADWISGRYFEYWITSEARGWRSLLNAGPLPQNILAKLMCWSGIATELGLSAGFLLRRRISLVIWGGILFHAAMLILFKNDFGLFAIAMPASYLAFIRWPRQVQVTYSSQDKLGLGLKKFFDRIDRDRLLQWAERKNNGPALSVETENGTCSGPSAFKQLLLYSPAIYFFLTSLLARLKISQLPLMAIFLIFFFSPLSNWLLREIFRRD
jgi:hypothetical protein